MRTGLLAGSLLVWASVAPAATLTCSAVPGWHQDGETRVFEPDTLFDYMNGNAEGYLAFGFQRMDGITCVRAEEMIVIDLSLMESPEHAYGILSSQRDPRAPLEPIGMGAQLVPGRVTLAKGPYYLEIVAQTAGVQAEELRLFATSIAATIDGQETPPAALAWFPEEGQLSSEPRLIPESVLGLRTLKSGYTARYEVGEAFVVPCDSAQRATQVMSELRERFGDTQPATLADEAFTTSDKYLGRIVVARKGPFVLGVARAQANNDPVPLVQGLLQRLP